MTSITYTAVFLKIHIKPMKLTGCIQSRINANVINTHHMRGGMSVKARIADATLECSPDFSFAI
jgi:hypothetical protein